MGETHKNFLCGTFLGGLVIGSGLLAMRLFLSEFVFYLFPDDAFYYLKIAQNISKGLGATFDGINPTNGFQPLWEILLVPLSYIAKNPWSFLYVVLIVQFLFVCFGLGFLFVVLKKEEISSFSFIVVLLIVFLNPVLISSVINGMESALYFFLLCLCFYYFSNLEKSYDIKKWCVFGILTGLCFLSRLEAGFLVLFLFIYILVKKDNLATKWRPLIACFLFFCLVSLPYLAYNSFVFGHPVPISGRIKLSHISTNKTYLAGLSFLFLLLILVSLVFELLMQRRKRSILLRITPWIQFSIMVIFQLLLTPVYIFTIWYSVPVLVVLLVIGSVILDKILKSDYSLKIKLPFAGAVIFFSCFALFLGWRIFLNPNGRRFEALQYETARWVKGNIALESRLCAWSSGMIAFFGERQVVNLDGLVNSPDYYFHYRFNGIGEFLRKNNVEYFVDYTSSAPEELEMKLEKRLKAELEPVYSDGFQTSDFGFYFSSKKEIKEMPFYSYIVFKINYL